MPLETVANWLKNENKNSNPEVYMENLDEDLKKIQKQKIFKSELSKYTALGNKLRLSIYRILQERRELCTCAISELFDVKPATLSHHLKILQEADLIDNNRRGLFTVYKIKA